MCRTGSLGSWEFKVANGNQLAMGWNCIPTWLAAWPGLSRPNNKLGPTLINQRENSKMEFVSTSVLIIEGAYQNVCCHYLCPQGESQLPLASPRGYLRSPSGSDVGSFQIIASALGLGACVCPLRNGISVSYNPLAFLKVSPSAFKAKHSGNSSSQYMTHRLWSPM